MALGRALRTAVASSGAPSPRPDWLCPDNDGTYEEISLCLSASATVVCAIIQLYLFCTRAKFRSHLSRLVLVRSIFDMLFAILSFFSLNILLGMNVCEGASGTLVALLTEVVYIMAELSFLIIAMDPVVSILWPFISGDILTRFYGIIIFSVATIFGVVFLSFAGNPDTKLVGRSSYGICWILNADTKRETHAEQKVNHFNVGFIYLPAAVIIILACLAQLFVFLSVRRGLPRTLQSRMRVLRRSMSFVLIYIVYYAAVASIIFINYASRECWNEHSALYIILHWLYGGRGMVTLTAWLLIFDAKSVLRNKSDAATGDTNEADTHMFARLNVALRGEILHYTTLGMRLGARAQERLRHSLVPQDKHTFFITRISSDLDEEKQGFEESTNTTLSAEEVANRSRQLSFSANAAIGLHSDKYGENYPMTRIGVGESGKHAMSRPLIEKDPEDNINIRIELPELNQIGPGSFQLAPCHSGRNRKRLCLRLPCNKSRFNSSSDNAIPFIDYFPARFEDIRVNVCGIDSDKFAESLRTTTKERFSDGASGAFLYFSEDRKYVIKSMTSEERDTLLSILPDYHAYLKNNPRSLLTRFLGCYSIQHDYTGTISFVVMQNIFATSGKVHETYDLKGSWVGRSGALQKGKTQAECRFCDQWFSLNSQNCSNPCRVHPNGIHLPKIVKKDSDVIWRFEVGQEESSQLCSALCGDADFLCRHGIMDYSLLVGVERRRVVLVSKGEQRRLFMEKKGEETSQYYRKSEDQGQSTTSHAFTQKNVPAAGPRKTYYTQASVNYFEAAACTAPGCFTFGVIDILQRFTISKKLEQLWKTYGPKRLDPRGISCVEPQEYCQRFKNRVVKSLIGPELHSLYSGSASMADHDFNSGGAGVQKSEKLEDMQNTSKSANWPSTRHDQDLRSLQGRKLPDHDMTNLMVMH